MPKFFLILSMAALFSFPKSASAQDITKLDDYKYVVIPKRFAFQNSENEFLFNSRVKFIFDKMGFNTVMKGEKYPMDLAFNRCLALFVTVKSLSEGMMSMNTELKVIVKNCRNDLIFETRIGRSGIKDKEKAYTAALKDAIWSFGGFQYHYSGKKNTLKEHESVSDVSTKKAEINNPLSATLGKKYGHNGGTFVIMKISAGYLLENADTGKRTAFLHLTENNTILYNSKTINGTATVTKNGQIIEVHYFDQEAGKLEKTVFREIGQHD